MLLSPQPPVDGWGSLGSIGCWVHVTVSPTTGRWAGSLGSIGFFFSFRRWIIFQVPSEHLLHILKLNDTDGVYGNAGGLGTGTRYIVKERTIT